MTYHSRIMNVPVNLDKQQLACETVADMIVYVKGHRDARHAAAEIALEADAVAAEVMPGLLTALRRIAAGNSESTQSGQWLSDIEMADIARIAIAAATKPMEVNLLVD